MSDVRELTTRTTPPRKRPGGRGGEPKTVTGLRRRLIPTYIGVAVLLVAYAVPALWLVLTSFKSDTAIVNRVASPIFEPTLSAYETVLTSDLVRAMWNSLRIAGGATLLIMFLGVPAAYALAHVRRGRGAVLGILIALQTIPLASIVIPMFKVLRTWHQLGTLRGVVIAISAMALPLTIMLLRPFFLSVPRIIEEAAEVDGAGILRVFFRVVLPNVRTGVLTIAVLTFIHAWGEFIFSITLLSDPQKYPLSALLSKQISMYGVDWNSLMAIAVLTALPMLVLFLFVARHLSSGLAMGYSK